MKHSLRQLLLRPMALLAGMALLGWPLVPVGRSADANPAPAAASRAWRERAFVVGQAPRQVVELVRASSRPFQAERFFERFTRRYRGVAYGAATAAMLRGFKEGHTLVNFESMDCVTFLENYIATALTCRQADALPQPPAESWILETFLLNLERVRYFDGQNCTWEDRIYYFTQALEELESQGLLQDIGAMAGQPFRKPIHYLSSNKTKYPGIRDWKRIARYESQLSQASLYWFPLDRIENYAAVAQNGDLVALATDVKGLDVSHCGLIHVHEGALYFTHASSVKKQVVYQQDLADYLSKRTSITGLFVYRPLF
jgi:hypothetical protein